MKQDRSQKEEETVLSNDKDCYNNQYLNSKQMQNQQNPLQFLDLRKKREQNKINMQKIKNRQKTTNLDTTSYVLPSFPSLTSIQNPSSLPNQQYNPLKYFTPSIQAYLQKNTQNIQPEPSLFQNINSISPELSMISSDGEELPFEQTFQKISTFEPQISHKQTISPMHKLQQKLPQNYFVKPAHAQKYQQEIQEVQLKQCEICSRKFNPTSYSKHVRVCERVFFQKRAPYDSRSKSKQNVKKAQ